MWTRNDRGRGTVGRQLAAGEVEKVPREVARHAEFALISEQIAEVSEKICEARPATAADAPSGTEGEKRLFSALAEERSAEIGRLAAEAARSLGCGDAGLEAAEAVIRAGCWPRGAACSGSYWPPIPATAAPGAVRGHEAELVSYRGKVIDTVLGPVALKRAWYHCAACGEGCAPRDAELGVAGASLSPGPAAMNDRAALIAARKLVPLPPSPLPDKLYAVIDGTGVPMTSRETAGRGR